jgi:IPT/TIG domain-containing protein
MSAVATLNKRAMRQVGLLTLAVAMTAVAHAQSTNRPQLVVQRAEADLTSETLLIEGQKLIWNSDSEVVVTLAGTPLEVLSAAETQVLVRLPPGLAPGSYLLKVSRGTGTLQNCAFDVTVGAVGSAGPPGPKGDTGNTGQEGLAGGHRATGTCWTDWSARLDGCHGSAGAHRTHGSDGGHRGNGANRTGRGERAECEGRLERYRQLYPG